MSVKAAYTLYYYQIKGTHSGERLHPAMDFPFVLAPFADSP